MKSPDIRNRDQGYSPTSADRRTVPIGGAAAAAALTATPIAAARQSREPSRTTGAPKRSGASYVTTKDGVQIYFKDWGDSAAQPIVFHHGWPLSADDWDNQMLFFVGKGYRVIAI